MSQNGELKEVYSVTELAAILGLSRTRLYQLKREGVFPLPVYCPYTRRPFYTVDLVKQCLKIRQTGRGFNGRSIIFYRRLKKNGEQQIQNEDERREQFYIDVMRFLKINLGENLTNSETKRLVSALYPNGLTEYKVNDKVANALIQYLYG
jgi:hypothetical protein